VTPAWDRDALAASVRFGALHGVLAGLPDDGPPTLEALSALASARGVTNARGLPLRFVPADGAGDYESRIDATGAVPTRAANWHDCFNALAWLAFPTAKATLSRLHREHRRPDAMRGAARDTMRGAARDTLTMFDEDGLAMVTADPTLGRLVREFRWRELFVERRADVVRDVRFLCFGHALHEKLLAPFHGLTAKAVIVETDRATLARPSNALVREVDALLASRLPAPDVLATTRSLAPLPVLGIPGWWPANEDPAYYDDTTQFRPGRRR
jgi:hypothetical protein